MVTSNELLARQLRRRADAAFSRAAFLYRLGKISKCNRYLQVYWDYLNMLSMNEKTAPPDSLQSPEYYFGIQNEPNNVYHTVALLSSVGPAQKRTLPRLKIADAPGDSAIEKLTWMSGTWFWWAGFLYDQGEVDLAKVALQRRWKCLYGISKATNTSDPEPPMEPAEYFGKSDGGSDGFPDHPHLGKLHIQSPPGS